MKRRSILVPAAKVAIAGVGFATNVMLTRALGADAFGAFATAVAVVVTLAGIVGNAVDAAALKLVPSLLREGSRRALEMMRAAFAVRALGTCAVIAVLGGALLVYRATGHGPGDRSALAGAVLAGIPVFVALGHVLNYWQCQERFAPYLSIDAVHGTARLAFMALVLLTGALTPVTAMTVYVGVPALIVLAALFTPAGESLRIGRRARACVPRVLATGKWVAAGFAISAIQSRLDLLMLGAIADTAEAGLYAAAFNVAMIPELLASFILLVFYPQIMPLQKEGRYAPLLKRYLLWMGLACALGLAVAAPLLRPVVVVLYTEDFAGAAGVLGLLLPAACVYLVVQPLAAPYLTMNNPRLLWVIESLMLAANFAGNLLLIPRYGAQGAALATLAARVAVGAGICAWSLRHARGSLPPGATGSGGGSGPC